MNIIAEAIAHIKIDVICFQEVGEYMHDPITTPYGKTPSNMAFRICNKLCQWGLWYHIHQDWSHIGFNRWLEGTAIMNRYPRHSKRYTSVTPDSFMLHPGYSLKLDPSDFSFREKSLRACLLRIKERYKLCTHKYEKENKIITETSIN
ncbi:MAG: hypothetical protein WC856_26330 [Methylococcaceae bacterium]